MRLSWSVNWWRWSFAALLMAAFYLILPSSDGPMLLAGLAASYFLSGFLYKWFKKAFFKPILLFDLHNVLIAGDWEVEDFYEKPGTRELVRRLRKKYFVAALTNMSPELWRFANAKFGFSSEFDATYHSGQYGIRKPDARVFQVVLRDLRVRPADVIFLDDREENVAAARKLGMRGVVFENAAQAEKELNRLGVKSR